MLLRRLLTLSTRYDRGRSFGRPMAHGSVGGHPGPLWPPVPLEVPLQVLGLRPNVVGFPMICMSHWHGTEAIGCHRQYLHVPLPFPRSEK